LGVPAISEVAYNRGQCMDDEEDDLKEDLRVLEALEASGR
jgi:hypothetical protein